jgi:hypothetical protein
MKHYLLISLFAFSLSSLMAQHTVRFGIDVAEVSATEKVYNFTVEDFEDIVGWQFRMEFDGSRMKYKEIRNTLLDHLTSHSFNEPNPGELRSVWLDYDLMPTNYTKPTIVFQIVFDILQSGGSACCFLESQENFEFIVHDGSGEYYLSELVIHDDCHTGHSIFFNTTDTEDPLHPEIESVNDIYLSQQGVLVFTTTVDQTIGLTVFDVQGKAVASFNEKLYTAGRHTLQCSNSLSRGLYMIQVKKGGNKFGISNVFAQ